MQVLDFLELDPKKRYEIMANTIIPRPIVVIATENSYLNLAPFSYISPIGSKPPLLMVSIGRKKKNLDEPKDTFKNIKETKKATISLVSKENYKIVEKIREELPFKRSEAEEFNVKTKKILNNYPPILEGSNVAFFTTLYGTFETEEMATIPFFLKIEKVYIKAEADGITKIKNKFMIVNELKE